MASGCYTVLSELILTALSTIPVLAKIPARRQTLFAHDLALIAASVRCAHLLDAFAVDAKTVGALDALMQRLREAEPAFEDVRAVYEPISGQMLFVNRAVLARVLAECAADPPWTTFVDISTSLTRVTSPPPALEPLLRAILAHPSDAPLMHLDLLPEHHAQPQSALVPLAGLLLEYTVAYVPPRAPHTVGYLGGVALDVYECTPEGGASTLLKFSCPHELGERYEHLQPETVCARLRARFAPRLQTAGLGELVITHCVETLDRVAL